VVVIPAEGTAMPTVKSVYWEEGGAWLGYLQDFPDYTGPGAKRWTT
jgi:hypothetical protein